MSEKLRNCPFCGGKAQLASAADSNDVRRTLFWAECEDCETEGPTEKSDETAHAAWNTRAPDAAQAELLREAVEALGEVSAMLGNCTFENMFLRGQYVNREEAVDRARATLAKIKGGV